MINKQKIITFGIIASVYIVSAGLSYFLFSKFVAPKQTVNISTTITTAGEGQKVFNTTEPKTEECPLNGAMYSKTQKDWWSGHRPLGVMVENHQQARPQSGLSFADIMYEAVAEGGITRFLPVFYCQDAGIIGPVRSARTYFLDFMSEYGNSPLYAHVGGANAPGPADSLSQIEDYGWEGYNDMNQFSIGFPTFWRDYDRLGHTAATEHTMYSTTQKLWDFAKTSRDLTNVDKKNISWDEDFVPYGFKDDAPPVDRPQSQVIHIEFWKSMPDYFDDWEYDRVSNTYKRFNGTKPHIDRDTNKQIAAKNLVILSMVELNANDGYENNVHLLYKDKGSGRATVFMDGKKIDATWRKDKRISKTLLFDENGNTIKLNRGLIWFSILPTNATVQVK